MNDPRRRNPLAILAQQAGGGAHRGYDMGTYSPTGGYGKPTKYFGNNAQSPAGMWNIVQRAYMQNGDSRWNQPTNQLVRFQEPKPWAPRVIPGQFYRSSRTSENLEQRLTGYCNQSRGGAFYITPGRRHRPDPY